MPPDEDRGSPAGAPPSGGRKRPGLRGGAPGDGSAGPEPKGVPSKTVLLAAVGVVLAGVWALSGLGVIDATMLFPEGGGDATRLVIDDKLGDCREARLDTGEGCEPGADVESVSVWWPDRHTLAAELKLTESPELAEGSEWTAELFAETANAFTPNGLICGLSNIGTNRGTHPTPPARIQRWDRIQRPTQIQRPTRIARPAPTTRTRIRRRNWSPTPWPAAWPKSGWDPKPATPACWQHR